MNFILYVLGVLLILLPLLVNAMLPGITSAIAVIAGFVLIIISSVSSVVKIIPSRIVETSEESFTKKTAVETFKLSQAQIDSMKESIQMCSNAIPAMSKTTNIPLDKLKYIIKLVEDGPEINQLVMDKETVIPRKNEKLTWDIISGLKTSLEKSQNEKELKQNTLEVIDNYSERRSLNDFLGCPERRDILTNSLNKLLIEKDITKFIEDLIAKRIRVPHYESSIYAFITAKYSLALDVIKPNIDKRLSKEILCDRFNQLLKERNLRDRFIYDSKQIAERFVIRKEITCEEARELLMDTLKIYAGTINLSRDSLL